MKIIAFAVCCCISFAAIAQDSLLNNVNKDSDKEFVEVEIPAHFPGGIVAWNNFIASHIKPNTPAKHGAPKGNYTVKYKMMIDRTGVVTKVEIVNDPGYGTAKDVERAVLKSPKWMPAEMHGHPVIFMTQQSITYAIN